MAYRWARRGQTSLVLLQEWIYHTNKVRRTTPQTFGPLIDIHSQPKRHWPRTDFFDFGTCKECEVRQEKRTMVRRPLKSLKDIQIWIWCKGRMGLGEKVFAVFREGEKTEFPWSDIRFYVIRRMPDISSFGCSHIVTATSPSILVSKA